MKIYRIHLIHEYGHPDSGNPAGYAYVASRAEANAIQARINKAARVNIGCQCVPINVPISKKGILAALNTWADHPDNG